MRAHFALAISTVLGSLLALVPAAGEEPKPVKIGIVTNCEADFWRVCEAGAKQAAKEHKVELVFRQPEKAFDASVQMPIIEAWAKDGLHGVAVAVIDPDGQQEDLTRIAKKIPFLTIDTDAPHSGRLAHIGIDNYEAGKAVGRFVKKALPKGGTVGAFIGSTKSAIGRARAQGLLDELAGKKDAKGEAATLKAGDNEIRGKRFGKYFLVDGVVKEDGDPAKAQATVAGVLARTKGVPDLCMIGLYAYNPPAILAEAKARKMVDQIKIVGFDEDWETLEAITKGEIEGTVVQDPFMCGYRAVEALAANARGDKTKLPKGPIPYRIVTKDGGPDEKVNGVPVKNLKAADFGKQLRELLAAPK